MYAGTAVHRSHHHHHHEESSNSSHVGCGHSLCPPLQPAGPGPEGAGMACKQCLIMVEKESMMLVTCNWVVEKIFSNQNLKKVLHTNVLLEKILSTMKRQ